MLDPSLASQLNIPGVTNLNAAKKTDNPQINTEQSNSHMVVEDAIHISAAGEIQERVDFLNRQLDDIFGMPKALSAAELEKEERLWGQIESILGVEEEPILSKADQRKVDNIFEQIDKVFKDDVVTAEEEKLLSALDKRLDEIYGEPPEVELTEAQNKQLDNLFVQLDELYGYEPLSKQQLINAEKIMIELDVLSSQLLPEEPHQTYDKEGGKV